MSPVMVTYPPAEETLLCPSSMYTLALLLAIVMHLLTKETLLMADFTTLAIVTSQLCSVTLLPPEDPAAGDHASMIPQIDCILVGDTADNCDPCLPSLSVTAMGIP